MTPTLTPDLPGGNLDRLRRIQRERRDAALQVAERATFSVPPAALDRSLSVGARRKALSDAIRWHVHPGQGTHTHGGPVNHQHQP